MIYKTLHRNPTIEWNQLKPGVNSGAPKGRNFQLHIWRRYCSGYNVFILFRNLHVTHYDQQSGLSYCNL